MLYFNTFLLPANLIESHSKPGLFSHCIFLFTNR